MTIFFCVFPVALLFIDTLFVFILSIKQSIENAVNEIFLVTTNDDKKASKVCIADRCAIAADAAFGTILDSIKLYKSRQIATISVRSCPCVFST